MQGNLTEKVPLLNCKENGTSRYMYKDMVLYGMVVFIHTGPLCFCGNLNEGTYVMLDEDCQRQSSPEQEALVRNAPLMTIVVGYCTNFLYGIFKRVKFFGGICAQRNYQLNKFMGKVTC